tara:strand:- start:486 stop:1157 length:672 start_codon:yes stop_codon:yes gene_type:complete
MRMIWKKRWGFVLNTYPIENDTGDIVAYRIGLYDDKQDLWWFSPENLNNTFELEASANQGWVEMMTDFLERQDEFPDGTPVVNVRTEVEAEIFSSNNRIAQLDAFIKEERDGPGIQPDAGTEYVGFETESEKVETDKTVHPDSVGGTGEEGAEVETEGVVPGEDSEESEHDNLQGEAVPEVERELSDGEGDNQDRSEGASKDEDSGKKASKRGKRRKKSKSST